MIVEGKKIAGEIIAKLESERKSLPPVVRLGVLMGGEDSASASFVKIKERVADKLQVVVVCENLTQKSTTKEALRAVERLSKACAGIIVQLPLPKQINVEEILASLPTNKDVDAVGPSQTIVRPPVAEAISEIFVRSGVTARNKHAVVVGAGRLVGAPAAQLLKDLGAHVSVITESRGSFDELHDADIVVLGAGQPGLIKPEMLREGVVLIDAGTSEASGRLVGDADPRCADAASVFTPVPGGIGPIAVAMLFKNLFALARANT